MCFFSDAIKKTSVIPDCYDSFRCCSYCLHPPGMLSELGFQAERGGEESRLCGTILINT